MKKDLIIEEDHFLAIVDNWIASIRASESFKKDVQYERLLKVE